MVLHKNKNLSALSNQIHIPLILLSGVIFFGVVFVDYLMTGQVISTNPQPQFSGIFLLRSFFIGLSALCLVLSVTLKSTHSSLVNGQSTFLTFQPGKGIQFSLSTAIILWGSLSVALVFVLIFIVSPVTFSILSNEDQIIETGSALFLFIASANLIVVLIKLIRQNIEFKLVYLGGLALVAIVLLVVGMEEVSWFQRSFGFETPEAFSGNVQGEFNLHNFASNESEIVYYFGSFVYLILIPFIYSQLVLLSKVKPISFFAPGLVILFVGAPFVTFNFNLWNNSTIQFAFYVTLTILGYYAYLAITGSMKIRYYPIILSILYLSIQLVFIWQGENFRKGWEVTEYKEFLIPMTFLVYSLELVMKTEKVIGLRVVIPTFVIGLMVFLLRILQKVNS